MRLTRFLRGPGTRHGELDEELQSHLRLAIRDRVERGEDPREAERAARREFGNLALVEEVTRDQRPLFSLERWRESFARRCAACAGTPVSQRRWC